MTRRKRKGSIVRTLISTLAIIVGVVICSTTGVFAVDTYCHSEINKWLPIYPDAELVETTESGFFRDRGSGITQQLYFTEDDVVDVRAWFRDYRRDLTSGNFNSQNADTALSSAIATTNYRINEDLDNGGVYISYYSECAYG